VNARGADFRQPTVVLKSPRRLATHKRRALGFIAALVLALTASIASAGTDKPDSRTAATSAAPAAVFVRGVTVAENGSTTQVAIRGDGQLSYHAMHLTNPERLVLDFNGTRLAVSHKNISSTLEPVSQIRVSQFAADVTRVVIDLKGPSTYDLQTRGNEVDVNFTVGKSLPEAKTESDTQAAPDASESAAVLSNSDQPASTNSATTVETDATVVPQSPTGAATGSGGQTSSQTSAQQETSHPQGKPPFASQQPQPAGAPKPPPVKKAPVTPVDTQWRTNTLEGVPQFGYHLWDTYNQNRIKGDYPLTGKWFMEQDIFQNLVFKERRNLDYSSNPTLAPEISQDDKDKAALHFFSHNNFVDENIVFGEEIRHNDDRFFPSDFRIHVDGAVDWKHDATAFLNDREDQGHAQIFDAFTDIQLHNFGTVNFNQTFLRAGLQFFKSDFHGIIFNDVGFGGRIFGNSLSNRLRYDAVALKLFQKDAVSGFIDFTKPSEHLVTIGHLVWEDFLVKGWNSEWSVHWNHDPRKQNHDNADQLNLDTYYVGTTLSGNLGRFIFNPAIYGVFGNAQHFDDGDKIEHNVRAFTGVFDLEYPFDFWKFRVGFVYASGESGKDIGKKTDTGFDAISDAIQLFGGPIDYWVGEDIKFGKGDYVRANSLFPSLRGTNGQANYVNPGLSMTNIGLDVTVTPRVFLSFNANWLYFNDTGSYPINIGGTNTAQTVINHNDAGVEENMFIRWKPFLHQINDFVILDVGVGVLQPLPGLRDAFGSSRPVYTLQVVPRLVF
jgi:hypothetical protein